jgi:hypothetical protein
MATEAPKQSQPTNGGATTPAAPAPTEKFGGRFSKRDDLLQEINNPLETTKTLSSYRYPQDVGSAEYPHYVAFYPMVRENSVYGKRLSNTGIVFNQSDQNRTDPEKGGKAATVAGALAGAAIGLGKALSDAGGRKSSAGDGAEEIGVLQSAAKGLGSVFLGGGLGGLYGLASTLAAGEQRAVFGDSEIKLHVSERVSSSYGANLDVGDLGGIVGAIASGQGGVDLRETGDYVLRKAAKLGGLAGFDQLSNVIEATSKKVENPYKEQLFRSMGFRKFVFDYKFSPRNLEEALQVFGKPKRTKEESIEGIIPTFLRHMHPTKSKSGLFLGYPSEFLIVYYYNGAENNYVRKISNCALVNMSIDYGAEGFTTFKGGIPSEATIRLEFSELETLTADRIEDGGF